MSLSEVTMEFQSTNYFNQKVSGQDKYYHKEKEVWFKKLRTAQSGIYSQSQLQTQEGLYPLLVKHENNTNQLIESPAHKKGSLLQAVALKVREMLGKVLECQKAPRKLSGMQFSHSNELQNVEGEKNHVKIQSKEGNNLFQSFVGRPPKKINFET